MKIGPTDTTWIDPTEGMSIENTNLKLCWFAFRSPDTSQFFYTILFRYPNGSLHECVISTNDVPGYWNKPLAETKAFTLIPEQFVWLLWHALYNSPEYREYRFPLAPEYLIKINEQAKQAADEAVHVAAEASIYVNHQAVEYWREMCRLNAELNPK